MARVRNEIVRLGGVNVNGRKTWQEVAKQISRIGGRLNEARNWNRNTQAMSRASKLIDNARIGLSTIPYSSTKPLGGVIG